MGLNSGQSGGSINPAGPGQRWQFCIFPGVALVEIFWNFAEAKSHYGGRECRRSVGKTDSAKPAKIETVIQHDGLPITEYVLEHRNVQPGAAMLDLEILIIWKRLVPGCSNFQS
jgi:hypothetical protein